MWRLRIPSGHRIDQPLQIRVQARLTLSDRHAPSPRPPDPTRLQHLATLKISQPAHRPRLNALAARNRRQRYDTPTRLRLQLLDRYTAQIAALDREEKTVVAELRALVRTSSSTLAELCGLDTRSVAELLVEVGDPRRFTEGGFARFTGTAPLPASTAEGPDRAERSEPRSGTLDGDRWPRAIISKGRVP
jgi:hypothetical protein